jgi:hypothetical protein
MITKTHSPVTLTGIRADMFVDMTREQASRLIRDLATMLAECETVQLRVTVADQQDWATGELGGVVTITDRRYGICPATGNVTDCLVTKT